MSISPSFGGLALQESAGGGVAFAGHDMVALDLPCDDDPAGLRSHVGVRKLTPT